jgi:hypothetical protein
MEPEIADKSVSYIIQRVTASGKPGRKPVGNTHIITLQTTLLPFFTATNAIGLTRIPQEALEKPIELATNPDGSPKFSRGGRLVTLMNKDISKHIKL